MPVAFQYKSTTKFLYCEHKHRAASLTFAYRAKTQEQQDLDNIAARTLNIKA